MNAIPMIAACMLYQDPNIFVPIDTGIIPPPDPVADALAAASEALPREVPTLLYPGS